MGSFWHYAKRMLRYRARVVLALVMAFVSAGGLGAGLVGLVPVLNNILDADGARGLPELVGQWNARIGSVIPAGWIEALPPGRFTAVLWIVAGLGALTVIGATANFLHAYLSITVSTWSVADIRRSAFHRLLHMPLKTVTGGHGSDLISRIINDTNVLARGFQSLTNKAVAQITKGAAALLAALIIDWRLSLVTLAAAPVLYVVIRKLGKRVRRASRAAMRHQGQLLGVANEVLQGFRVVKVHSTERYEIGRFTRTNNEVVRQQLRARTARALASPLMELIAILVLGVLALVAAKAIIDGHLEPTNFLLALGSLAMAGQSLKPLSAIVQDVQTAEGAANRLGAILGGEIEEVRDGSRRRLPRHRESIAFDAVSFRYDGAESDALSEVSLTIPFGERVAVVGGNGSGKTTLLSLVPRLFDPAAGRVLVDGVDVAGVSLRSLRRQIGVVPQETVLFRGTIASNIAYGVAGATRAMIEEAARLAHADEFIGATPQGYDTPVGDQGLTLSGGQRQRLAIARAIIRDPAILIMDEATSMIDAESERLIASAVGEFAAGRTCLIVAHRLSTVINADRIVVMEAGRVADVGTHEALLERCEAYRILARGQLQAVPEPTGDS